MRAALEGLQPHHVPLKLPAAPCASNIIDEAFHHLDKQEAAVLFGRYGTGLTREELAGQLGLQPDQVNQTANRALNKVWGRATAFRAPLQQLFSAVAETGFTVFELTEEPSQILLEERPATLWNCSVKLYAQATGKEFVLQRLQATGWVLFDSKRIEQDARKLDDLFRADPAFLSLEDVADQLGIDAYDLLLGWPVYGALCLTRSGLLGYSDWTELESLKAVAAALAAAGVAGLISDELTQALHDVFPGKFPNDVAGSFTKRHEPMDRAKDPAEPSEVHSAHSTNSTEGDWQETLALFQDFGAPQWTALLSGLARSRVPAPTLDDVLCDLAFNGRTTGHTALALWRRDEATLALVNTAAEVEARAELIRATPDSESEEIAQLIREFTEGFRAVHLCRHAVRQH